ncbi:hypothetical protein [Mycolicibacterium neoaurum]|uniref:hypothetical protein n=1 Tax=Mycolicibacterium neoaurum TaxID=1795 RepID=UPI000689FD46|nr:hypothetical protein [Mycolicibacterium neoaurum]
MAGDAIRWARTDIDELQSAGLITSEMAQRGKSAVDQLFDERTVFASISPLDGTDLSFYWVAGQRSIEIDLCDEPDCGIWYCVRDGSGQRAIGEVSGPTEWLRVAVAEFSAAVDAVNPNWRELSPRYAEAG